MVIILSDKPPFFRYFELKKLSYLSKKRKYIIRKGLTK